MPTNANTFNSRVTSEALEAKFRNVFPAQGGAELIQDLYASGVIQPVIDFSSVAEGSVLPQNLQTAWDFSTGSASELNSNSNIITNPGFWLCDLTVTVSDPSNVTPLLLGDVKINDGTSNKRIWGISTDSNGVAGLTSIMQEHKFVVFLRAGDVLNVQSYAIKCAIDIWYRQIADVYGNLVNPLGFTSQ